MIESLAYEAKFNASGAAISGVFQPKTGITAVVGENGSGKTFGSIECLRWALYGKAALRGAASDYKDASVTAKVKIRGTSYTIRRGAKEDIKCGEETLAVGAEKVTEQVIALMGYDLSVFDICNAATQGDVQKLGQLKPAERKKLIDRVLALTDVQGAEKSCKDEANGYKREAEALVGALRSPGEEPHPPAGYCRSAAVKAQLDETRRVYDQAVTLRAQLRAVDAPSEPEGAAPDLTDLEAKARERMEWLLKADRLLKYRNHLLRPEAELAAAEERLKAKEHADVRGPLPTMTQGQIDEQFAMHQARAAHEDSEEVECPNCQHRFFPTGEAPPLPSVDLAVLRLEQKRWNSWGTLTSPPLPDGVDMTAAQIAEARAANAAQQELIALGDEPEDVTEALRTARQGHARWDAYHQALAAYEAQLEANAKVQDAIDALGPIPTMADLDRLQDAYREASIYEAAAVAYDREVKAFEELTAKINEKRALSEKFAAGASGLAAARAKVKALLAPKLSRIASKLLTDMTAGKLTRVEVDDEMEISVDGQRLETLSGAGKTVANLALRVAMGQALTAGSFPVFLGDEIDGDLDVVRREATTQAMAALKDRLAQIILVTHKDVEIADHVHQVTG